MQKLRTLPKKTKKWNLKDEVPLFANPSFSETYVRFWRSIIKALNMIEEIQSAQNTSWHKFMNQAHPHTISSYISTTLQWRLSQASKILNTTVSPGSPTSWQYMRTLHFYQTWQPKSPKGPSSYPKKKSGSPESRLQDVPGHHCPRQGLLLHGKAPWRTRSFWLKDRCRCLWFRVQFALESDEPWRPKKGWKISAQKKRLLLFERKAEI